MPLYQTGIFLERPRWKPGLFAEPRRAALSSRTLPVVSHAYPNVACRSDAEKTLGGLRPSVPSHLAKGMTFALVRIETRLLCPDAFGFMPAFA